MRDHAGAELVPVATAYDEESKSYKAHVVPGKGNVEGVAEVLDKDLEDLGRGGNTELLLRCDQEHALNDLVREIKRKRTGPTTVEHSKAKDSQSNGTIERAIQGVEGMVRTLKLYLESNIKITIPAAHPIMNWLVEHGAEVLNRFHVGPDGRTAYERVKGKKYQGDSIEFGRSVHHRHAGKVQGGSMEARWSQGVWLGTKVTSGEHMISMSDGTIVQARSVMLKPENESWNAEEVLSVKLTPWNLKATKKDGTEIAQGVERRIEADMVREGVPEGPKVRESVPRDPNVTPERLAKYGYTKGCAKCERMRRGDRRMSHHSHSHACKERVKAAMLEDDLDRAKVEAAEERKNEYCEQRHAEAAEEDEAEARRIEKKRRVSFEADTSGYQPNGASSSSSTAPVDSVPNQGGVNPSSDEPSTSPMTIEREKR